MCNKFGKPENNQDLRFKRTTNDKQQTTNHFYSCLKSKNNLRLRQFRREAGFGA
jgi:hypothetical protein